MAASQEPAAQAPPKLQRPTRITPAVPHALNTKNRASNTRAESGSSAPAKGQKENEPPVSVHKADQQTAQASGESSGDTKTSVNAAVDDQTEASNLQVGNVAKAPEASVPVVPQQEAPAVPREPNPSLGTTEPVTASRPAPQELPPPFYPSNSASVASIPSQQESAPSGVTNPAFKSNANNLVFGGFRDSANSSPAPLQPPPAQYVGNQWQGPPAAAPGTHTYHMSEPHVMPVYMPPFVHNTGNFPYHHSQSQSPFGQPRTFYPHNPRYHRKHEEQNAYYRYPAQASRAHPNAPPGPHMRRPFDDNHDHFRPPYQQGPQGPMSAGMTPSQYPTPGQEHAYRSHPLDIAAQKPATDPSLRSNELQSKGSDDSSNLLPYVRSQFGNREFADYAMQLSHTRYMFPPVSLPTHAIIMSRCPKLRSLMAMQHGNPSERPAYPKILNVPVSDRFLNSDAALMKAIARLYGDSLLDQANVLAMSSSAPESTPAEHMRLALAYAAAGHFLEIDEIISCGLEVAGLFLGWENIGQAFAFSLEGGLSSNFAGFEGGSEDRISISPYEENAAKHDSPPSAPAYGFYSDRLLNRLIGFVVHRWPLDFEFSSSAPQLQEAPRLPAAGEPQRGHSDSRFSHIRFGEMTLDDHVNVDPVTSRLSSVLISLPFQVLKRAVESSALGGRIGWTKLAGTLRAVVAEREARRQRAINNKGNSGTADSAVEERLWHTICWCESLEQDSQLPLGAKLARVFVGLSTPSSSESTKS